MNYEPERLRNTMSRNYITNRYQTYPRRKTTKGIRENVEDNKPQHKHKPAMIIEITHEAL